MPLSDIAAAAAGRSRASRHRQEFRRLRRARSGRSFDRARRVRRHHGAERLRQDHASAHRRRPGIDVERPAAAAWPGHLGAAGAQAQHAAGVAELRAVSPSQCPPQHRLRPDARPSRQGGGQGQGRRDRRAGAARPSSSTAGSASSPAARSSASPLRARSSPSRRSCCSTSRLSALDAHLRIRMQSEMKRLQQRLGLSFLYVTHNQSEAFSMADRVVVMNKGRIEQFGAPEEIYTRPRRTSWPSSSAATTSSTARSWR